MQAQADLLVDLAVPHGDDSSSALTTSNGSVMDNYRQAQLAAWRELWPSVDRGPLRAVVSLTLHNAPHPSKHEIIDDTRIESGRTQQVSDFRSKTRREMERADGMFGFSCAALMCGDVAKPKQHVSRLQAIKRSRQAETQRSGE
ncbi:unnamed protein product [Leuciscus chuanchicus]